MGIHASAYLMYGYDLGSDDAGWHVEGVSEYETLNVPWREPDAEYGSDFITDVESALLKAAGFTETDYRVDGYYRRRAATLKRIGVEVETCCMSDYPSYALVATTIRAYQGDVEALDLATLTDTAEYDQRLGAALVVLGITPTQKEPAWLLASYLG